MATTKSKASTKTITRFAVSACHYSPDDDPGYTTVETRGVFKTEKQAEKFVEQDQEEFISEMTDRFGGDDEAEREDFEESFEISGMTVIDHNDSTAIHEWSIDKVEIPL